MYLLLQGLPLLFLWEKEMTVSTTTNKVSYVGNGIATQFAVPFPFLETSHLKVYQLLNDIQTERTDWTLSSGNLTFATAPATDAVIVIIREVPFTQETDYRENEIFSAETLERNFDKLTMQVQQLKEQADRAVTVDVFDNTQAADLLPSIRTSVSNAATYAQISCAQAGNAQAAAQKASAQASLAADKAQEAVNTLSDKAYKDLSNCTRPYVIETYHNESDWYRVWSDGFIEEGGFISPSQATSGTINLLKPFSSAVLNVSTAINASVGMYSCGIIVSSLTYFTWVKENAAIGVFWNISGY